MFAFKETKVHQDSTTFQSDSNQWASCV